MPKRDNNFAGNQKMKHFFFTKNFLSDSFILEGEVRLESILV